MATPRRGPRGYIPSKRAPQRTTLRPKAGPFRGIVFRSQKDRDEQWEAYRSLGKPRTSPDRRKVWHGSERFRLLFKDPQGHPRAALIFSKLPDKDTLDALVKDLTSDPRYPDTLTLDLVSYRAQ